MTVPRVGMALIVRDEADTIEACLESFAEHVDAVAILDTGSKDGTLEIVHDLVNRLDAREEAGGPPAPEFVIGTFDWIDDFAAARTAAEALLPDTCDWIVWADADDIIHGAEHLRALAAQAPADVSALVATYDYASDEHGNVVCQLKRERLVRRGHGTWGGRVHEAQDLKGPVQHIPEHVCRWVHRKPIATAANSNTRNLRILRGWVKDEPENARVLMYLGTEEQARHRHEHAVRWLRKAIRHMHGWDEQRAQTHRKLAQSLLALGRPTEAIRAALDAVQVMPQWPDSYLTLAEAHYAQRELDKAVHHAQRVLELGVPDTLLIIDPTQYQVQPHVILAGAHAARGEIDKAIAHAEHVLRAQPGHESIAGAYHDWLAIRKRESTADSFLACADLLVAHDEQLKALAVLDAAPHYCRDHPRVVAARSALRERINPLFDRDGYAYRYAKEGSKDEDMISDEQVLALGDALPRCQFLLDGLRDLAAAA